MHINKNYKKPVPNLFPHGKGNGMPLVVKKKRISQNVALERKLKVRKIKAKKRAKKLKKKLSKS